jgi:hypothetical protein
MRRYLLIQVVLLFNTIFCFAQNNAITFSLQANGQFVSSQGENNIIIKTSADSCKLYKILYQHVSYMESSILIKLLQRMGRILI